MPAIAKITSHREFSKPRPIAIDADGLTPGFGHFSEMRNSRSDRQPASRTVRHAFNSTVVRES